MYTHIVYNGSVVVNGVEHQLHLSRPINRGDIWVVSLDPASGREQQGHRPAVVLSSDLIDVELLGLVMVVPATTSMRVDSRGRLVRNHLPVLPTLENGLAQTSYFMCEQLKSVSLQRLTKQLGRLNADQMSGLQEIIELLLDF